MGRVTGGAGDGGIDGTFKEDKLGPGEGCLHAKYYASGSTAGVGVGLVATPVRADAVASRSAIPSHATAKPSGGSALKKSVVGSVPASGSTSGSGGLGPAAGRDAPQEGQLVGLEWVDGTLVSAWSGRGAWFPSGC